MAINLGEIEKQNMKRLPEKNKKGLRLSTIPIDDNKNKDDILIKSAYGKKNIEDVYNYANQEGYTSKDYASALKSSQKTMNNQADNLRTFAQSNGVSVAPKGITPSMNYTFKDRLGKIGEIDYTKGLKEQQNTLYSNMERTQKETDENVRKFQDVVGSTDDYKDYVKRKEEVNPLLRYSKNVKEVEEKDVNFFDKAFSPLFSGVSSSLGTGEDYTLRSGAKIDLPTKSNMKSQKAREESGKIYNIYSSMAESTGAMLPGMVMGSVPVVGHALGTATFAGTTYNSAKNQALLQGYDEKHASRYATANSILETSLGSVLGGITPIFGKTAGSKAIGNVFSKVIKNPVARELLSNMGSEFTEEYLQEYLDPIVSSVLLDDNSIKGALKEHGKDFFSVQNFEAGLIGALNSAILNAPSSINQLKFQNNINSMIKNGSNPVEIEQQLVESGFNQKNAKEIVDYAKNKTNNVEQFKNNNSIDSYTQNEINNFKNGKVKVVQNEVDISNFVEASTKMPSNAKLYFGKISTNIAEKIKTALGINVENYNISLPTNSVRHIFKNHGVNAIEAQRGQVAVTIEDFKLIPQIISEYDNIKKSGITENNNTAITFEKKIGDNYYLVSYTSDKNHNLEVKTMWKIKANEKDSATASDALMPRSETSKTDNGTSPFSISNDTTNSVENQVAPLPINTYMQNDKNNTSDPIQISNMTPDDANTTPMLPNVNRNSVRDGDSRFASNIENKMNMLNRKQKQYILSYEDVKYYDKVTNQDALTEAFDRLNTNGASETVRWFSNASEKATSVDVAEGYILLNQYSKNGEYDQMVEVAKKLRDIGTKAGQTVQAFNIMERMTPEGMVKYAQNELLEAYDQMVKNKSKEWINKHRSDFDLKPAEVEFIMNNMQEVSKMEDGYDKRVKLAEIQKLMTDKLPPEKGTKIKSWMRISMLFNPKTQVRNVVGNALIAPVNYFSDVFSSYADKLIAKKTDVRTTGNVNIKAILKGFKDGAYQATNDYKKGINTKDMEGNRFEIGQGKSFSDKNIIGRNLNRVEGLLNYVMDAGDRMFSQSSFENSLQNQMILNNTTEVTQDMIDIARTESLQRTWNDNNNYTKFVLNIRKMLNKIGTEKYGLGDVLIPFAKTPANLTKAIVDYSPVGLVNTLVQGNNLRKALNNGQYTPQMQHRFVQTLGKATAGTMLYIAGYALAKAGISSGKSDDDKDTANFLKNTLGVSSYSIKIGGKTFTYDWAQPLAAPLSITANIVNSKNKDQALGEAILSNLDTAGSILLEQSFLTSINEVLNDNESVISGLVNQIINLPARAVPTFSKQIADMVDGTQRTSYEYDKPVQTAINSIKAKIPGLSKTLAPSVDTMGREIQKYGGKNNLYNVFLNPANVNTQNISKSAEEIYRLYKETGKKDIMPRVAPYYINKDNQKIILTSKKKAEYQKVSGEIIESNVNNLLKLNAYKNLDDDTKANVVNDIVNFSYNIAQNKVLGLEVSQTYQKAFEYSKIGNISDYYSFKNSIDNTNKDTKKESISKYLVESDLNDEQLAKLYGSYYSTEKNLNNLVTMKVPIKEFIKLNSQEIESNYDRNGKTISGSKKKKVIDYVNSLKLTVPQKAVLIKSQYNSYDSYNRQIIEYVNNLNKTSIEKKMLLKSIGFDNYDKDIIYHVNSQKLSKDEKEKKLKGLGFTVRNGRAYK